MPVENYAKEIKGFAFMPVCRTPDPRDCRHMHAGFVKDNFQAEPMMLCRREEMIIDFKARLFFNATINSAEVGKEIKLGIRVRLQGSAYVNNVYARHDCGYFAMRLDNLSRSEERRVGKECRS